MLLTIIVILLLAGLSVYINEGRGGKLIQKKKIVGELIKKDSEDAFIAEIEAYVKEHLQDKVSPEYRIVKLGRYCKTHSFVLEDTKELKLCSDPQCRSCRLQHKWALQSIEELKNK